MTMLAITTLPAINSGNFIKVLVIPPPSATNVGNVADDFVLTERLPEQAYFWTSEWQSGEQEADEDIRHGRLRTFQNANELIAYLNSSGS